jgi:hypothetical protein
MKKEEIPQLEQIITSLGDAVPRLEQAYEKKDSENFNKIKKFIIQGQRKISEIAK